MPAAVLSDQLKNLLDSPVFIVVGTIQPDGSPQLSPVWVKRDGDQILFSTTADRRKKLNLDRDSRVSILIQDPRSPYEYAEIRGTAELTKDGARELIDELSLKYTGKKYAEFNPESVQDADRVVVRVLPRKVVGRM
ncbi:PPOX class F420-dependent oxidoreductase [Streptomyces colonosanans]|uniref:PPOX class F420-dependent enzyme n=1 Tax=Streptomyces colonosanans TaxID=1428652 RepID=A0A1S2Q619_9ACTN|nr:PPOX class F420-dependent oxidoreductase [Streptomyces colonosanans]OIK01193.1 PPOX class F420-dependent enzyme [Streptomyces colonosanans]